MTIKKILVSQPRPASEKSPYFDIANSLNVEIVFRPFIKVEGVTPREFRQQKINILDYSAVVFTSRHAVDHFFKLCVSLRVNIPEDMKYFCITETVALYIQNYVQYRKRKVFFGTTGKADGLMAVIYKHKSEKYFIPMSDVHNDDISEQLAAKNICHACGVMYRTVSNDFMPDEVFDYDMLIFFSPNGVRALQKNFPNFEQGEMAIGCFGPSTAQAVRDAGLRLDLEAPSPEYPSITAALRAYIAKING